MATPSSQRLTLVLLPGLDGTGRLFSRLVAELPGELEPRVVALPTDGRPGYPALVAHVREQLPRADRSRSFGEMRRLQPSMEHRRLDAPHLVLQRQPAACAEIISGFLRGLVRSTA